MPRLAIASAVFGLLFVLSIAAPGAFLVAVLVAFVAAPAVNWRAYVRLRWKLRASELERRIGGSPPIASLRSATSAALFLAVGSSISAALGLLVGLRWLAALPPMPRELLLVLLVYPPILATAPAFEWLVTLGRIEEDEVAARDREA